MPITSSQTKGPPLLGLTRNFKRPPLAKPYNSYMRGLHLILVRGMTEEQPTVIRG